jgi:hypothetical protein
MAKQWDQAAIQSYIDDGIEESLTIEYKAAGALGKSPGKRKEIAKDVSAMANSAGGIIIYGVSEYQEQERKHLPEKLDPIDRPQFSKEWLEHVIAHNVRPRIEGLIIHPVSVDTVPTDVIYVVDIPQSTTAHQVTADYRYYKRHNFESVPMENYEIRDVMNRATTPDVDVEFWFADDLEQPKCIYRLRVKVKNQGVRAVNHFKLTFEFLDFDNFCSEPGCISYHPDLAKFGNATVSVLDDEGINYIGVAYRSKEILFPGDEMDIGTEIGYTCTIEPRDHDEWFDSVTRSRDILNWTLYADDMPPRRGEIPFPELFH